MENNKSTGCGCSVSKPACSAVSSGAAARQVTYHIENMDCPTEETLIRDKLGRIAGVQSLDFNLMQRTLTVGYNLPSLGPIEAALATLGMRAKPVDAPGVCTTVLHIAKMDCPTEEGLIRKKLGQMPGVAEMQFNLMQRRLTMRHTPESLLAILAALRSIGLTAEVQYNLPDVTTSDEAGPIIRVNWWLVGGAGVAAFSSELAYSFFGGVHWPVVVLALASIATGGLSTYKKGWIALKNRSLNMNALMSIAVTGAMLIGHWPEAAMVMFLFTLAEIIESKSLDRARNAIRGLLDLTPPIATVRQPDGNWENVPAKNVTLGMVVRVKPGERLALDGVIINGQSAINQAPITGESLPVDKTINDTVFAGTINESGSFEYRVTASASDSTLARIIHAVESAQGSRAPTQRFVDQFARIYTPSIFAVAFLMAVVPPLATETAWMDWIYKALVLLVIACPCALVISTPVTIVSGLAAAARKGILIKGGIYLEVGRKLTTLALDKTGTITHGKPTQTDFRLLNGTETKVRTLAASLAVRSDHPVSQAIARAAREAGTMPQDIAGFTAIPGRGVRGEADGQMLHLGNHRLLRELGLSSPELEAAFEELEQQDKTVVMLAVPNQVLGLFAIADTVKESSRQAVVELHALGVRTLMLTGDNPHTAAAIAQQVGIDEARGNQLPEDKLNAIALLTNTAEQVGMVGDGINDAPALARADIGFAMGAAGADTAIETADVALMDDDLRKIPAFIRLSRTTASILTQNIALALGIKLVFLSLTFMGSATMWMAVFADMGTSLLVVLNGLRLLRHGRAV